MIREWINLVDTSKKEGHFFSSDFVIEYVAEMNDRDDPYEGDVPERILAYNEYELRPFPVGDLQLDGYQFDHDLADEYAKITSPFPSIVVEPDGEIIDGFHRAQAAKMRGDRTISAYVGIPR